MSRTLRRAGKIICAALAATLLMVSPSIARHGSLSPDGVVHTVTSELLGEQAGESRLLHETRSGDTTVTRVITGTEDPAPDIGPWISAEPKQGGRVVAAWSRWDGSDFEIAVSVWGGKAWGQILLLTSNKRDDVDVRVHWGGSGLVHLMWRAEEASGTSSFYEARVDTFGNLLQGPDLVSLIPVEIVPEGGTSNDDPVLFPTDVLFAFDEGVPGDRMSLYGGRDEPMPITGRIDFERSSKHLTVDAAVGISVAGRLVFVFQEVDRMHYTVKEDDGWTAYRTIPLDSKITWGRAFGLLMEMLSRTAKP